MSTTTWPRPTSRCSRTSAGRWRRSRAAGSTSARFVALGERRRLHLPRRGVPAMSAVGTTVLEMPATMQALVLTGPHEFEIREDVPIPRPGPNEVLARVRAIAICGTDAEIVEGTFKGRWPRAYPFIPGHEWSGEIVEAGDVAMGYGFRPGTRVAGTTHSGC